MRLLAFDCSGDLRSAALVADGEVVAAAEAEGATRHAEALVAMIDRLLADAGWTFAGIDRLAVGRGPGSFTGIRIAVAAARGLALALDRPVIGVDGRDVLLQGASERPGTRVAAIDARRGGLYAAWADTATVHAPGALPPAALAALLPGALVVRGSGAALLAAAAGTRAIVEGCLLDARGVAAVAATLPDAAALPGHALLPLYLRSPDAVPQAA